MEKTLAIIEDIHVGMRDCYYPICWFTVKSLNGNSLQIIEFDELKELLQNHSVYKLEDLEGKPCIIESDRCLQKFIDLYE